MLSTAGEVGTRLARLQSAALEPVLKPSGYSDYSRPGEACGVFGVYAPETDAAHLISFGLMALQHRGQESAGRWSREDNTLGA